MRVFSFLNARRGQSLVLAPVMLLAVGATAALSVDVGRLVVKRATLQNTCDASSLAGAEVILDDQQAGCDWSTTHAAACREALRIFQANTAQAQPTIEFGNWDRATGTFTVVTDVSQPAWGVRVTAARNSSAPGGSLAMCFAGLLGTPKADVSARAVAQVATGVSGIYGGLSPFAVPETLVDQVTAGWDPAASPGPTMTFYPGDATGYDDGLGTDAVVPGNWGLLNLDGGSLSNQDLITEITNHNYSLDIPPGASSMTISGCSGFRAGVQSAINSVIGVPLVMAVYSTVTGNGSSGEFTIVGFISCEVISCDLTGNSPQAQCQIMGYTSLSGTKVTAGSGGYVSPNLRKIQLVQ